MAEPTIQQVFGAGSSQTSTTLTIAKADLAATGLTASANNTAESLFTAILLLAKNYLTSESQEANADQSITINKSSFNFQSYQTRNNQQYEQFTYEVNLQNLATTSEPNPNNY